MKIFELLSICPDKIKINETFHSITEALSGSDLARLKKWTEQLYQNQGIDLEFSDHFLARSDERTTADAGAILNWEDLASVFWTILAARDNNGQISYPFSKNLGIERISKDKISTDEISTDSGEYRVTFDGTIKLSNHQNNIPFSVSIFTNDVKEPPSRRKYIVDTLSIGSHLRPWGGNSNTRSKLPTITEPMINYARMAVNKGDANRSTREVYGYNLRNPGDENNLRYLSPNLTTISMFDVASNALQVSLDRLRKAINDGDPREVNFSWRRFNQLYSSAVNTIINPTVNPPGSNFPLTQSKEAIDKIVNGTIRNNISGVNTAATANLKNGFKSQINQISNIFNKIRSDVIEEGKNSGLSGPELSRFINRQLINNRDYNDIYVRYSRFIQDNNLLNKSVSDNPRSPTDQLGVGNTEIISLFGNIIKTNSNQRRAAVDRSRREFDNRTNQLIQPRRDAAKVQLQRLLADLVRQRESSDTLYGIKSQNSTDDENFELGFSGISDELPNITNPDFNPSESDLDEALDIIFSIDTTNDEGSPRKQWLNRDNHKELIKQYYSRAFGN